MTKDSWHNFSSRRAVKIMILLLFLTMLAPFVFEKWIYLSAEDDAYYYFSLARNLASGKGITYNGEWSNGFQPLWLFLITPFFKISSSELTPIICSLFLGILFFLLSGFWVKRSAELIFSDQKLADFTWFLWLSSVFVFFRTSTGMETGLYLFSLALLIYLLSKKFWRTDSFKISSWLLLGAVSGLCFLCRIDAVLILPPLWLGALLRHWKAGKSPYPALLGFSAGFLFFLILALPWLGYNLWLWGKPYPVSGVFTYASLLGGLTLENRFYQVVRAILRIPAFYPISFVSVFDHRGLNLAGFLLGMIFWISLLWRKDSLRQKIKELPFLSLLVSSIFLISGYLFFKSAHWFMTRYLAPVILLALFPSAILLEYLLKKPVWKKLALWGLILLWVILVLVKFLIFNSRNWNYWRMENVSWICSHLSPQKTLAGFNSGLYHYYLTGRGYRFYNLDGKVSLSAYQALRERKLDRYLKEKKISYLLDGSPFISAFLVAYDLKKGRDYQVVRKLKGDYLVELIYSRSGQ